MGGCVAQRDRHTGSRRVGFVEGRIFAYFETTTTLQEFPFYECSFLSGNSRFSLFRYGNNRFKALDGIEFEMDV